MKSHTTERFRKAFAALPAHVQRQARRAYGQFLWIRPTRASSSSRSTPRDLSTQTHKPLAALGFTTTKPLAALGQVLHDGDLAEAILDRVLERGTHFLLRGRSWRLRHRKPDEGVQAEVGDRRLPDHTAATAAEDAVT